MTYDPYQAPTASVRDRGPLPHGRIPDWIVVIAAVFVSNLLTIVVVPKIAMIVFWDVLEVPFDESTPGLLWTDLILSAAAELAVFYLGARLARGRPARVIVLITALTLVATVIWRWQEGDYDSPLFPVWYEAAILLLTVLAGVVAFLLYRRRVGSAGHAHAAVRSNASVRTENES